VNSITIGLTTIGCTFAGALIGVWLQSRLPPHHLDEDSQEVVKLGAGMIATITALVRGLLVSSAKGTFDTINDGIKQSSARLILLDRILAQYGPEAQGIRDQMKRSLAASLEAPTLRKPAGTPGQGGHSIHEFAISVPGTTHHLDRPRRMAQDRAPANRARM
jgi:hypothetical protein